MPSKPFLREISGDEKIVLKWEIENNGGSPITNVIVLVYEGNIIKNESKIVVSNDEIDNDKLKLNRFTYTLSGNIKNGTPYTISIVAENEKGYSDMSNVLVAKPYKFLVAESELSNSGETLQKTLATIQSERNTIIENIIDGIDTGNNITNNLEKLKEQIGTPEFDSSNFLQDKNIKINFI